MSGFSPATRKVIHTRANGRCERCTSSNPAETHHRRPRGMGGSKDLVTNTPANGVLLCSECHRDIESRRTKALQDGWLLRQAHDPRKVPVFYHSASWRLLTVDGELHGRDIEETDCNPADSRTAI